jgi:hypothetical protein
MILGKKVRNTHGIEHNVYAAEYLGEQYELDPLERAMKDCGVKGVNAGNRERVLDKMRVLQQMMEHEYAECNALLRRWETDAARKSA